MSRHIRLLKPGAEEFLESVTVKETTRLPGNFRQEGPYEDISVKPTKVLCNEGLPLQAWGAPTLHIPMKDLALDWLLVR